jgi:hypothetical protein
MDDYTAVMTRPIGLYAMSMSSNFYLVRHQHHQPFEACQMLALVPIQKAVQHVTKLHYATASSSSLQEPSKAQADVNQLTNNN